MRYKNIMIFFGIALPVCVITRIFEIIYATDTVTGFIKIGYKSINYRMLVLMLIAVLVTMFLSLSTHRCPVKEPKINPFLGFSSIALGVCLCYEISTETFVSVVRTWQIILLDITGLLAALYFIAYGLRMIVGYKLPRISAIIPSVYFIFRLICIFTAISSLSLIMDNVVMLASYCVSLIFFVSFAKLINGIDSEYNFKKVLASGLCSIILCATMALPTIILTLSGNSNLLHSTNSSALTVLFMGIFILAFTISFFSNNNLQSHNKNHHCRNTHQSKGDQSFYTDPGMPTEKPYL